MNKNGNAITILLADDDPDDRMLAKEAFVESRLRNQLDATASLNSGGDGLRLGLSWRGPSRLESRIGAVTDTLHFSPVTVVNLRAFTDLKRLAPNSPWTKGLRLSLDVINLLNDRQDVRDSAGSVPLQYQPGYRDPLGRSIEFEIRKVF